MVTSPTEISIQFLPNHCSAKGERCQGKNDFNSLYCRESLCYNSQKAQYPAEDIKLGKEKIKEGYKWKHIQVLHRFMMLLWITYPMKNRLTESTATVSCENDFDHVVGSVGRIMPHVEVKIGENNEILLRGVGTLIIFLKNKFY